MPVTSTRSTPDGSRAAAAAESVARELAALTDVVPGAAGWTAAERHDLLRWADRALDAITLVRAGLLVAEREAGTWRDRGDRSLESWRARTSGAGARSAAAQVRQAEQLATVPAAAAAVTGGSIGLEHAAVLARAAATGSPAQQAAVRSDAGQAELLALARRQDAGTYATTVARWVAAVDPDALEADHEAQRRERFLHLATTPRGTFVKGRLDTMAGHRLTLALEALTPRPAADDDRDAGQRAADALDSMATHILSSATTKPGAHVPPHVSLILSEETWVAAREHRDRRRAAARASAVGAATPSTAGGAHPPVTLEDGTPVPASEAAVVLCDCAVTRIAVDASGLPLDLGRTRRLFSGEQRRAIIARDRECIWPGCHLHARWCEIHHRVWWERDGGRTSVEDGVLLCSFHHHETHSRDLAIVRILGLPIDGPPGGRRRRGPASPVGYEFRDPAGRLAAATELPPGWERAGWSAPTSETACRDGTARRDGTAGLSPSRTTGGGGPDPTSASVRPRRTTGDRRPHATTGGRPPPREPTRTAAPVS